jgi:hypothetical protein
MLDRMSRRGVVTGLLYAGLTMLFLVSLLASLSDYLRVARVGLEPWVAFRPLTPETPVTIVEPLGEGWWPSITVEGEAGTATVSASWLLVSPLLVLALTAVVVAWRRRRRPASPAEPVSQPVSASDGTDADTQPIPVTR